MNDRRKINFAVAAATFLLLVLLSSTALADAIDGNWCNEINGRRLSINGPEIVTPGGNRITGNYGRHDFSILFRRMRGEAGRRLR